MCVAAETYEGAFGRWSVTSEDVAEVYGYRAGISVAAAGVCVRAWNYTVSTNMAGTPEHFLDMLVPMHRIAVARNKYSHHDV